MFVTSANLKDVALTASADFVALILVTSGFAKVFRPKPYISALRGYGLIPAGIFHAAAISLPFAEIVAGITLFALYAKPCCSCGLCRATLGFCGSDDYQSLRGAAQFLRLWHRDKQHVLALGFSQCRASRISFRRNIQRYYYHSRGFGCCRSRCFGFWPRTEGISANNLARVKEEVFMVRKVILGVTILAAAFLAFHIASATQAQSASTSDPEAERTAVNLLRMVNTAEVRYEGNAGNKFAELNELVASPQFKSASDQFAHVDAKLGSANFSDPANVFTGWGLRLYLSPDSQHFVAVVSNDAKGQCAPMFVSDDQGLIRKAQTLGCTQP